jgi:hypothetical protein
MPDLIRHPVSEESEIQHWIPGHARNDDSAASDLFMRMIIKMAVILCIILSTTSLFAANPASLQTDQVIIVFAEPLRSVAEEVAAIYPSAKKELEDTFQWPVDFRPTVALINDRKQFQQMVGSDQIVAYALPRKQVMVIDYSRMNTSPFTLKTTIKHELCHLLLHHYIDRSKLPRWFDEGVCQWVSDGFTELIMDFKQSNLTRAILSGRYFRMHQLNDRFPSDKASLQLAYAQSKSLVDFISREFGKESILTILNNLRYGLSFEKAIRESLGVSFTDLELDWIDDLKNRDNWLVYVSIYMYEFLFVLGALVVVVGFVRVVIRKKKRYAALEDDEDEEHY